MTSPTKAAELAAEYRPSMTLEVVHAWAAEAAALLRASEGRVPDVLFDGYAVLQALDKKARVRTSADNVSDVLDAVVRLLRAQAAAPNPPAQQAEPVSMREALLKCKTCNLPTEVRELVNEALRGAPHKAEGAEPTADDLREPKNGKAWRVEWWNESMRLMLPTSMRLDGCQRYSNGTMQLTLKAATTQEPSA